MPTETMNATETRRAPQTEEAIALLARALQIGGPRLHAVVGTVLDEQGEAAAKAAYFAYFRSRESRATTTRRAH